MSANAATLTVTTTGDAGDGSLRQAILEANTSVGVPDTIVFDIPVNDPGHVYYMEDLQSGLPGIVTQTTEADDANLNNPDLLYPRSWYRISPATPLPPITDPVVIDGYTQGQGTPVTTDDATPNSGTIEQGLNTVLRIELYGAGAGFAANGLFFNTGSDGSEVRGLAIRDFSGSDGQPGHGILVLSDDTRIEGNFLGPGVDGLTRSNNTHGLAVVGDNNTIGSTSPGSRNLVSANNRYGMIFGGGASGNVIQGNLIGLSRTGVAGAGNFRDGILILDAPNNTVGGLVADARNIVSGNGFGGISILNAPSSGNVVQGNYVGVDITGGVDIGNSFHGVLLLDAPGNTVGGTDPGAGNVSAGNGFGGVTVERSGNSVVQGNYLGTDPTGALAIPNDFSGVVVVDSSNNTIGGSEAGANTIAFNAKDGVIVSQNSVSNLVRSNSIYSNGALGIDLSVVLNPNATGDGVTSNDAGDPDTGTNNLQNFPDLVSAEISGTLNITYSVDSVSPNSAFPLTIEFFIADAAGQEGKTIIGSDLYNQGDGQKVAMISTKGTVGPGTQILATATDADGNTSEFSSSVAVGGETSQTIFVVNSTGAGCDQNLIDGICDTGNLVNGEPECTLCAAIEEANVKPNQSPDAPDEIRFDIPANDSGHLFYQDDGGSGVTLTNVTTTAEPSDASIPNLDPDWPQSWYSIDLLSALPPVTDPVVIDGYTQSGASENTNPVGQGLNTVIKIELNGEIAGQVNEGLLRIAAGDSVLKGLVINRSDGAKVYLDSSGDNRIEGCFLGPDVSGTEGFPPPGGATAIIPRSGVFVLSGDNLIGGLAPAARNLISGNIRAGDSGIAIQGSGSRGTIVEGNLIGTDRTGTQAIPNRDRGVFIDRSFGNTVGGPTDGAANVLSGNENWGINILVFGSNPTTDNLIEGNVIGADVTGTQPLGNGADGVSIEGATGNLVVENTIAFNAGAGIFVEEISQQSGFSNGLIRNSIFSNTSLGIDLGLTFDGENLETPDQVNFPQDEGDPDIGANNLQNFPRITGVDVTKGGPTSVTGFFRSAPNSQYRIEFFASEERHPTGFGEGQFFLGDYDLTTDANGAHDFTAPVGAIPSGYEFVTCTATDLNDRGSGPANDTSEFCGAFPVQGCGFTVTNTADSGLGSLRDAIFCSNLIPGIDTIDFAIPGAGPHLVQPNTPLPYFRDSVTIDGYTQGSQTPGDPSDDATPNTNPIYQGLNTVLKIQIDGTNAGNNASGLILLAGESLVRGLSVTGFDGTGIVLQANGNNSVTGNFIGVAPDGSPGINDIGILINSSLAATVGGPDPADRNLISANDLMGIYIHGGDSGIDSADARIQGNILGADITGAQPMGNDVGLEIYASIASILENIVAFNTDAGMLVFGQEVSILRNSLFLNDELGIDLDEDGVTTNDVPPASDPPDQDTGANNLQNFPELISRTDAGTTTIMGTLRSVPNTDFRIEFFSNLITDLSGFGEGQSYLGFVNVTTNPAGIAPIAFDAGILVPEEQSVTSTATRRDGTGNPIETSEFSARIGAVACSTVVTTANDGGIGSLREAIQCANFNSGVDTISFDIPGPGPHKILLEAPLPEIFDPVVIDGYTQGAGTPDPSDDAIPNSDPNGFNGKLLIEIDGSQLDPGYSGLVIYSGVSTVRGLAIGGFQGVLDASEEFVFGGSALDIEEVGANTIEGNFFGTDVTGTVANPNAFGLVAYNTIAGGANRIGGTSPAARNVVSGNAFSGLVFQENDFIGNSVQGYFIGTDSTGRRALGNGESGVFVFFDSNNEIGGAEAGAANVISGNLQGGVDIGGANASDNLTQENFIGTDLSQTLNLGNSLGGVNVYDDAAGNPILGNVISFNGALGIDLGYDGLTPNDEPPGTDPPDQDSGPNRLQNFPVLTSVGAKGVTTNIQGSLASTPNTQFRIEFFANNICDASGSGEGLRFLGFDVVTTDPQGVANIATVLSEPVFASEFLTSTATVIEGPSDFGDTSEFSECLPIEVDTGPTPTPVPTGPPECPDFDFDESGFIGPEDLLTLFAGLQTTDLQFDISGDGVVDDEDLLLLNACWHLTVSQ